MLTREQVFSYSKTTGLKPHQQEKSYILTIVLRSLFVNSTDRLVFKGGTALAIADGLRRFSDDLDFTAPRLHGLEALAGHAVRDLTNLGMPATLRMDRSHKQGSSCRISCQGPLYSTPITAVTVRVEMSHREEVVEEPRPLYLDPIYLDVPPFSYLVMSPSEIMAEKVRAMLTRNQARDLFDLAFLIGKGYTTNLEIINRKLTYYGKTFDLLEFLHEVDNREGLWIAEMDPIVLGRVPDFHGLKAEVGRAARTW